MRTRLKKKSHYLQVEQDLRLSQSENNKLKLDNAALRAEN